MYSSVVYFLVVDPIKSPNSLAIQEGEKSKQKFRLGNHRELMENDFHV